MPRLVSGAVFSFFALLALGGHAWASTFDPNTGRLSLDDAAYGYGFDAINSGSGQVYLEAMDWGGSPVSAATRIVAAPQGLEGSGAFALGGEVLQASLDLSGVHAQFAGRRVDMRLWMRPQGTRARVELAYYAGDWRAAMYGDWEAAFPLSYGLAFVPTGRVTSDGWVELSTGPVDYRLGGMLPPAYVSLADVQFDGMYSDPSYGYDASLRVAIDAFEILDLGAAAVPSTTCTLQTEASLCGPQGLCSYGRCVDYAVAVGAKPNAAVVDDYLARRIFELEAFEAVRVGRQPPGAFAAAMLAAGSAPEKRFWTQIAAAFELLVDGHSYPPMAAYPYPPASGFCVYVSEADLLPGGGLAPMVYTTKRLYAPASLLQPGDVLVGIDGMPVADWRALASRFFYYGGDPSARAFLQTPELVRAAAAAGAVLNFVRCPKTTPCSASELRTVDVDYSLLFGQDLYANRVPSNWYSEDVCDFRFSHPINSPDVGLYAFAGTKMDRGVRVVEFNGFPSPYSYDGAQWMNTMNTALGSSPALLLMDQRRGDGGYPDSLIALGSLLLSAADGFTCELFPWFGPHLDDALLAALRQCGDNCGGYNQWSIPSHTAAAAQNAKLAVLFGLDVSANDYFSRGLQFRSAPTRFFGAAPTYGAFGVSHSLASYLGEVYGGGYQGSDTIFWKSVPPAANALVFESGTGVPVHQLVYQKQSDAVAGRDTMYEAAMSWLMP